MARGRALAKIKAYQKKDYPGPEAPALRPIHGFATAISKASLRQSLLTLTWPRGPRFPNRTKVPQNTADRFHEMWVSFPTTGARVARRPRGLSFLVILPNVFASLVSLHDLSD
jgi:hypothetical protein